MRRRLTTCTFILVLLAGCPLWKTATEKKDNCEPGATRCDGGVAEICGSDKRWDTNMDCSTVTGPDGQPLVCCATPDGHTCLVSCEENVDAKEK